MFCQSKQTVCSLETRKKEALVRIEGKTFVYDQIQKNRIRCFSAMKDWIIRGRDKTLLFFVYTSTEVNSLMTVAAERGTKKAPGDIARGQQKRGAARKSDQPVFL